MSDAQDTDKLEAILDRGADFVALLAKRLNDGWQPLSDGPALAAFFLEAKTRKVITAWKEASDELKDLKPYEIAGLVELAAKRAKTQLKFKHNEGESGPSNAVEST